MSAQNATRKTAYVAWAFAAVAAALIWATCALMPATAHAAITSDQTGSITINELHEGDTVNVYRVVVANYDKPSNNLTYELVDAYDVTLDEYSKIESDSSDMKAVADEVASKTIGTATPEKSATASGNTVTISDLPMGQYLISVVPTQEGAGKVYQNTIVSLIPDVEDEEIDDKTVKAYVLRDQTVNMKSVPVSVTKSVDNEGKTTDKYAQGEAVPFTITASIPAYDAKAPYKKFNIVDTVSDGLAINADSLFVMVGDDTLQAGKHFNASAEGEKTLKVEFVYDEIANYASQTVTLHLTATVTSKAVAKAADKNTATVEFMNNPYVEDAADKSDDEVEVVTYGIYIKKVAQDNEKKVLANAEFDVLKDVPQGTQGAKEMQVAADKRASTLLITTLKTGKDGIGKADGLGAGTYYLKETKAPDGYEIPKGGLIITVQVSAADVDQTGEFAGYRNGGIVKDPAKAGSAAKASKAASKKSTVLPKTGDMIKGGAALVLAAALIALIVARRKRREN